jgi:hypothetical protein
MFYGNILALFWGNINERMMLIDRLNKAPGLALRKLHAENGPVVLERTSCSNISERHQWPCPDMLVPRQIEQSNTLFQLLEPIWFS